VRESDEIPSNLRVHPCHWSDCHTSCETPETLHKHILSLHTTLYVSPALLRARSHYPGPPAQGVVCSISSLDTQLCTLPRTSCPIYYSTAIQSIIQKRSIKIVGYISFLKNISPTFREEMSCEWVDCSVFGKKFRNISLFGRHIQTHTGALNFACIWEGCSERYLSN
jgi:hypothetical protein